MDLHPESETSSSSCDLTIVQHSYSSLARQLSIMAAPENPNESSESPELPSSPLGPITLPSNLQTLCASPNDHVTPQRFAPTSKSFLDLPLELRHQIYGYFEHIPLANSQDQKDREEILKSRRVLQLICRKINQEWSEFFFRTTTIIANGPSPKPDTHSGKPRIQCLSPGFFEIQFLKKVDLPKLQQLRRIRYQISAQVAYERGPWPESLFDPCLNIDAAINLATILSRHRDTLTALEEVTFLAKTSQSFMIAIREPVTARNRERLWYLCGSDGLRGKEWIELRNRMQTELQDEWMRDWQIVRRLKVLQRSNFSNPSNISAAWGYIFDEVEVVYRKLSKPVSSAMEAYVELAQEDDHGVAGASVPA